MRTLLLDNHDSFTFNLFHLLGEVNGEEPVVVRNDACSWPELAALRYDNIVISPGPGTPSRAADLGLSASLIRYSEAPLLGVCLGHQALVHLRGGEVNLAPTATHGRLDEVFHSGGGLFADLPSPLRVVRYHSLLAREPLPPGLRALARTRDGLLMAVEGIDRGQWGVQFHPESICSEGGRQLLRNFRDLSRERLPKTTRGYRKAGRAASRVKAVSTQRSYLLHFQELPAFPDPESAFLALYGGQEHAFWLDSARIIPGLSRWSFMGSGRPGPTSLTALQAVLQQSHLPTQTKAAPFPFVGGWVGWIAYEAKRQAGYRSDYTSIVPEVCFLHVKQFLVFDHQEQRAWAAWLAPKETGGREVQAWFDTITAQAKNLAAAPPPKVGNQASLQLCQRHGPADYLARIDAAQEEIRQGESYELCLTNRLEVKADVDPLDLYRHLRRLNPAPWAAFLRTGDLAVASSSPERFLACTAAGRLQAKPIKGTAPRHPDPAQDQAVAHALQNGEKDRAENLMIVDLLRHDLGQVAELGSVEVPSLMAVESYETVHQLVSTIEAQLAPGLNVVDAITAAFPPGSMTGAPKERSMEILERLEGGPRGIYSGALGWVGVNGAADLAVVIRTLVQEAPGKWSLGAGGAITALSDRQAELEEMYLKARAPVTALARATAGRDDAWVLQATIVQKQTDAAE